MTSKLFQEKARRTEVCNKGWTQSVRKKISYHSVLGQTSYKFMKSFHAKLLSWKLPLLFICLDRVFAKVIDGRCFFRRKLKTGLMKIMPISNNLGRTSWTGFLRRSRPNFHRCDRMKTNFKRIKIITHVPFLINSKLKRKWMLWFKLLSAMRELP